eukprot:4017872-Amphidinium_carterae.1
MAMVMAIFTVYLMPKDLRRRHSLRASQILGALQGTATGGRSVLDDMAHCFLGNGNMLSIAVANMPS